MRRRLQSPSVAAPIGAGERCARRAMHKLVYSMLTSLDLYKVRTPVRLGSARRRIAQAFQRQCCDHDDAPPLWPSHVGDALRLLAARRIRSATLIESGVVDDIHIYLNSVPSGAPCGLNHRPRDLTGAGKARPKRA